ncbi:MAG: cytochrome c oxidase subunit II [Pseudomonadota bacterium]|nr:cytochrome c oxidase subunit II [Pseudomonadota bacterium]HJO36156.1 cytochrome c oxidase subunit II [Gammaproteobacteria bacterium]
MTAASSFLRDAPIEHVIVPPQASELAARYDGLLAILTVICGAVLLLITVLIVVQAVRFRARGGGPRGYDRLRARHWWVEAAWTLPTLIIFLGFFAGGLALYLAAFEPTQAPALTINVIGKQWMWKAEHPNGAREINELHVPAGVDVQLRLTSQDVIHSFFVPALRVKRDVLPGRYTTLGFNATRPGIYSLFCAEYCGTDHSRMRGRVVVLEEAAYADWLSRQDAAATPAAAGAVLFRSLGCSGCHAGDGPVAAPSLAGVYGRRVPLADGRFVLADEAYLRDSILLPRKHVVAGFAPVMPSYAGQVDEAELLHLIAYLQSLGAPTGPAAGPAPEEVAP